MPKGVSKRLLGYRYQHRIAVRGGRGRPKVYKVEMGRSLDKYYRPTDTIRPLVNDNNDHDDNSIHSMNVGEAEGVPSGSSADVGSRSLTRSWQKIKEGRDKNWSAKRSLLVDAAVKLLTPPSTCVVCNAVVQQGIIRCQDCGPRAFFCDTCFSVAHRHTSLHFPEIWQGLLYTPYAAAKAACDVWTRGDGHSCHLVSTKTIRVFDRNGNQHTIQIEVCPCEDIVVMLLKQQLWATSPKDPTVAVHLDLMEWGRVLQIEAHVSTKKFVDCVELKSRASSLSITKRVSVYQAVIRDCMAEYQYFRQKLMESGGINDLVNADDGSRCPPCHGNLETDKLICIDANFGLVRKRSAGSSCYPPKHRGRHFIEQETVDAFVSERERLNVKDANDQLCSEFQAGSSLRTKGKAKKLEEKGVLGSACRHDFPLLFCSLMHGERFSYIAILLEELLKLPQLKNGQVTVVYDVACQLEGHLKRHYAHLPHERLHYAIPVFHAYGHKRLCQLIKSLRVTRSVGLADGENLERLWSYLRCFASMTKEMGASKRVDLLTYALMHYSRKERRKLGQSLRQRLDRSQKAKIDAEKEIRILSENFGGVLDEDLVKKWSEEDVPAIQNAPRSATSRGSIAEDYAVKLFTLYTNPNSAEAERDVVVAEQTHGFNRTDWTPDSHHYCHNLADFAGRQRQILLEKMKHESFDRKFLISTLRRYGIGQAISSRIGKQIKKTSKKLAADVAAFNKLSGCPATGNLPTWITFEDASNPDSACFVDVVTSFTAGVSTHVLKIRRQMVAAYAKRKRAEEEEVIVQTDCKSTLNFFQSEHAKVLSALKYALQADGVAVACEGMDIDFNIIAHSCQIRGQVAFLFQKLWSIEWDLIQFLAAVGQENTFCKPAMDFVQGCLYSVCQEKDDDSEDKECAIDLLEELNEQPDVLEVLSPVINDCDFEEVLGTFLPPQ